MSSYSQLYWLTRLDSFQGMFIAVAIISGIVLAVYWICKMVLLAQDGWEDSSLRSISRGKMVPLAIIFPIFVVIGMLIPTRNEAIFIIAGGKTIDFIKKDSSINRIPEQSTKLITDFMQKQIDNMKSKK